jgi:hypothetical protein
MNLLRIHSHILYFFSKSYSWFGIWRLRQWVQISETMMIDAAAFVSGAIFLILEMYRPLEGLMQISSAPLRNALAHLGHYGRIPTQFYNAADRATTAQPRMVPKYHIQLTAAWHKLTNITNYFA